MIYQFQIQLFFTQKTAIIVLVARVIQYLLPTSWIQYDKLGISDQFVAAKAAIQTLQAIPFQKRWVDELQRVQLKLEISGTSRIENAEFIGEELDDAIRAESPEYLRTRSQRQALAATRAYEWAAGVPLDRPITVDLIRALHALVVSGCDDDHCPPGTLRKADQNVTFGFPRHRAVKGGLDCEEALATLCEQLATVFREHDPLIQAMAVHYHFAAMHPFLDGNGRTARALEALLLRRAGFRASLLVPMSNFYHDEKDGYLQALAETRRRKHELTSFLVFALSGVEREVGRVTGLVKKAVSKEIFRGLLRELYVRLESPRTRVLAKRQLKVLEQLLDHDKAVGLARLIADAKEHYADRKHPLPALGRDLQKLVALGAITIVGGRKPRFEDWRVAVNLDWPSTITETEFFDQLKALPKFRYAIVPSVG